MVRPLPYPGYSWSFTQHAVAFDPQTIYLMLQSALPFEGGTVRCGDEITKLMIGYDLLTPNNREGVESAWRDYQQVLSEFGLLYSTQVSPTILLTDVGHMYVAGSIGYAELMNQQVLRYQYPNGQKNTIQSRLRGELQGTKYDSASNLIELQNLVGILVKPGLLILQVLLELAARGASPSLSVFECRKFLLPSRTNAEWPICVDEVLRNRKSRGEDDRTYIHANRNIQDWFKFLNQSDIFVYQNGSVSLSPVGFEISNDLRSICASESQPGTFWIAPNATLESRLTWFDWFGTPSLADQPNIPEHETASPEYVERNFVAGPEEPEDSEEAFSSSPDRIELSPLNFDTLGTGTASGFSGDIDELIKSMIEGVQKRQAKTILHDKIVKEIGERLKAGGAAISCGFGSIDLFAEWPTGESAIFEVKTVTKKSLQGRLRSAIGQLHEYQYRRILQGKSKSDLVIAINSRVDPSAWQSKLITDHMGMGMLCRGASGYFGASHPAQKSAPHWTSI